MPQSKLINVDELIGKIEIPETYQKIYDRFVLFGMRLIFQKDTFDHFTMSQLNEKQSLDKNIGDGVGTITWYMVMKMNGAIPPIIVMPTAVTLALKCYDFLQLSNHPGIKDDTLGNALQFTISEVLRYAKKNVNDIPKYMQEILAEVEQNEQRRQAQA